ncbi:MAG: HEAT repeat domain-containing protein [Candidatus Sericytochromatia bacterium]
MFGLVAPTHSWSQLVLLFLCLCIGVLLLCTVGLVMLTLHFHHTNARKAEFWKLRENKWEPLVTAVMAGQQTVREAHHLVSDTEQLYFVDFLMRYARRVTGRSLEKVRALAFPYLPALAQKAEQGDEEQRARAIWTLSLLGPDTYRPVIVRALNDEAPLVNMLAARSLADGHGIEYLPLVLERLERFRAWSPNYLTSMLVALAQPAPEKLREALTQSQPEWVKVLLLKALTELNDSQSLGTAAHLLSSAPEPEVLCAALQLVGKLGSSHYKKLVSTLCQHADFGVRLHAVKALHRLGNREDEALLRQCFEDPSQWIAREAALGLREMGALEVLEELAQSEHPRANLAKQMLQDWDSDKMIGQAVRSSSFLKHIPTWLNKLSRQPRGEGWRQLQKVLAQPEIHPEVQRELIRQLPSEAARVLSPALHSQVVTDPNHVAPWMVRTLIRLEPLQAWPSVSRLFFKRPEPEVQQAILEALQELAPTLRADFIEQWQSLSASAQEAFSPESRAQIQALQSIP